ncbi:hypothetical protein PIB30_039836 [Stylosanthes scabra]|uniref:Ribonuclease H1 N-terminal domain-containing protein n=1 Tax=Stylosanthes scabra TaxID=79078 RepID=A0ABU6SED1_9FABA|nr:hypothetical protein [Stylosanthes scabra]
MDGRGGKFYAVRIGKNPGIYRSWDEAEEQVMGFGGAGHKSFFTYEEVVQYMGRRSRRSEARGANGGVAGARAKSLAGHFSRCRVTTWRGGDPGFCSSSPMEASQGGFSGKVGDSPQISTQCQRNAERFLGMACQSLGLGFPVFVPQQIEPSQGKELFGYTVILPKLERGLEVVAYGSVDVDEETARMKAAELMVQRVLAAIREKMTMLEAECVEIKQVLGSG